MNFLHSVLFTIKMGSKFPLFISTKLTVSKIDPTVIGSNYKRCEVIPFLFPSILYHHILPLSRLRKILKVHFELHGTQDMVKIFLFAVPFKPGLFRCLIYLVF